MGRRRANAMRATRPARQRASQAPARPCAPRLLLLALIASVAGLTLACHWPVLACQAHSLDDNQYLTDNPLVQNPGWPSAARFFREILEPSTVRGYYQPLAMISLMIDYALGGRDDNLAPFHRTTLILHVLNTVLVVTLLYLLFRQPWVAALAGLLFGTHPMAVEPVAWLADRKTVLATFFALASLVCYVSYARRTTWSRYAAYAASTVTLILALLSKPTTIPLPALMLLLDYWPLRRLGRRAILEKIPWLLIAGLAAIVTVVSQQRTSTVIAPGARSLGTSLLILCHNVVFYLYKIVWPAQVSGNYPFPSPLSPAHPMVLAGLIGTGVLLIILLVSWRWTRAPLVGWLFFFVAIFPAMGVIGFTLVIAADKFAYLPAVGLLLIVAWVLGHLWGHAAKSRSRIVRRAGTVVAVLLCAGLLSAGTRLHYSYWRDSLTLYGYMVQANPESTAAHYNLGLLLVKQGRNAEAAEHFATVLRINPQHDRAHREMGLALERMGRSAEAVPHYQEAIRINPLFVAARLNLAAVYVEQGRFEEAFALYAEALRILPNDYFVRDNLAWAHFQRGDYDTAIGHYELALRLRPDSAEAHYKLGAALLGRGDYDAGINELKTALRLDPNYTRARQGLQHAERARAGSGD